jgi:STE24 endopeptidase
MKSRATWLAGCAVVVLLGAAGNSCAQEGVPPGALPVTAVTSKITIPDAAQPSAHFDVEAATGAYIEEIPASARAHSDAYFEGGYWLILWDFLYAAVLYLILLRLGWSARMRDLAERITRFKPLQTLIYWVEFMVVTRVLSFPLAVYEGYVRERQYGLATQTLLPWLGDQIIMLLVNMFMGGVLAMLLVGVVRRWPSSWWFRSAVVSMIFMAFGVMIAPVFLFPLLNKFTVLDDPKVTQPILSLARANGIPAQKVYQMDASRQTTRMSANVSGYGQTMRITLNDNLLRRGSPEEIQAVMGHEMGHYVLHHIAKDLLFFSVLILIFFASLRRSLDWSLARWGAQWQIRGIGDTAAIPLVFLLGSIAAFLITPFFNTHIRSNEFEADMYGLNASRQPDGFAEAAIHLGEYRKMSPGPVEEWIFFDHPSGRNRIRAAMRWKAENLQLASPKADH